MGLQWQSWTLKTSPQKVKLSPILQQHYAYALINKSNSNVLKMFLDKT